MKIAATGYVSEQAGSVASANALLLRALLDAGHSVDFFSKSSFVDPRPAVGRHPSFRFYETDNRWPDRFRARVQRVPLLGFLAGRWDCRTYDRLLLQRMRQAHRLSPYDLCLWLGDYAPGRVANLPMASFAQGPPGTDARSVLARFSEIRQLAGLFKALQMALLAGLRLSRLGLPNFAHSDHIIVGSQQSRQTLHQVYQVPLERISTLPYPIDLEHFQPCLSGAPKGPLKVLWLGRIIPRKRLDVFLGGLELALGQGLEVQATLVGGIGFIPGYSKLIDAFPFPDRLRWIKHLPREQVPALLHKHDVLVQPSDEENFGSSVAEAQACGLPVIVGCTNGNADYLSDHDVHLMDDRPESFAAALQKMKGMKTESNNTMVQQMARAHAERNYELQTIVRDLVLSLHSLIERHPITCPS